MGILLLTNGNVQDKAGVDERKAVSKENQTNLSSPKSISSPETVSSRESGKETGIDSTANTETNSIVQPPFEVKAKHVLADGSSLLYKENECSARILTLNSGKGEETICDGVPSRPAVAPDLRKFAYIDALAWEDLGEVYMYDIEKGQSELIIKQNKDIKEQYTPKVLTWLDNRRLLVIIGYAYGTVTAGGDLYLYNVDKGKLELVLTPGDDEEISDIKVNKDKVIITYAKWDEERITRKDIIKKYNTQDFLNLINKAQ
jgi:hypothetical protein